MIVSKIISGVFGAAVAISGSLWVSRAIDPIKITHMSFDTNTNTILIGTRLVGDKIRRPEILNEVVDVERNETVCLNDTRYDADPNRPREAVYPLSEYVSPDCYSVMVPGVDYVITTRIREVGKYTVEGRTKPFRIGE